MTMTWMMDEVDKGGNKESKAWVTLELENPTKRQKVLDVGRCQIEGRWIS